MKHWIIFIASLAIAIGLYQFLFPVTGLIIALCTIFAPSLPPIVSIAAPVIIYFLILYLGFIFMIFREKKQIRARNLLATL